MEATVWGRGTNVEPTVVEEHLLSCHLPPTLCVEDAEVRLEASNPS